MNKNINSLIQVLDVLETFGQAPDHTYEITALCMDSRVVTPHALFVCIKGYASDGHAYAKAAYEKGARVFVVERKVPLPEDAYQILVSDPRLALARLSCAYYDYPAKRMHLIGITGTKGKTTTSLFIRQILESAGIPTGYIGTNGIIYGDVHKETANSTPESLILQENLYHMANAGVKAVVIEVSSQGLWMHRVEGLTFDTCLFTNLSTDHIGTYEHPDFNHYKACKKLLFTKYSHKNTTLICNIDDPEAPYMLDGALGRVIYVSTQEDASADYVASAIKSKQEPCGLLTTFKCSIHGKPYTRDCRLPMVGEFNVKNALCALAVAFDSFGIKPELALRTLSRTHVDGRFEALVFPSLPQVTFVIDYAHNGLSMAAALDALRACNPTRLICVFGSVGCRSKARRAELAQAAGLRADLCVLTSDNPNIEDPMTILREIDVAFPEGSCPRKIIVDRREALEYVVDIAKAGDIILLAGKGHEHTQVICGEAQPYNEKATLESVVFLKDSTLSSRMPF